MNSPYAPPTAAFLPTPPAADAIRLHGAVVFAALPLFLLVIIQFMFVVSKGLVPDWRVIQPTLILAPVVAITGACGFSFALQCARSSRTGIVLLGIAIGVVWGIGADIAGTLVAGGMDAFAHRAPGKILLQTVKVSACITPVALINCWLVRRYGRRGANNVAGVKP